MKHSDIRFDPVEHRYFYGEQEFLSLHAVLEGAGLIPPMFDNGKMVFYLSRGEAVHAACHFHDEETLDEDTVGEDVRPYLAGWRAFISESGYKVIEVERIFGNESIAAACRVDRIMDIGGGEEILVEIKTGQPAVWHGYQLAGQAVLSDRIGIPRIAVYLDGKGKYKRREWNDENDYDVFQAAVVIAWERKRLGIWGKPWTGKMKSCRKSRRR